MLFSFRIRMQGCLFWRDYARSPQGIAPERGVLAVLCITSCFQFSRGPLTVMRGVDAESCRVPSVLLGLSRHRRRLIHVTRDDGATWKDVTSPAMTAWSKSLADRGRPLRRRNRLRLV